MHDLLEYKDKYQICKRFVLAAGLVFALGCGALVLKSQEQKPTLPLAWARFLNMLASGVAPVKIALDKIEFKDNKVCLIGTSILPLDKKALFKRGWRIKKLPGHTVELIKDLR